MKKRLVLILSAVLIILLTASVIVYAVNNRAILTNSEDGNKVSNSEDTVSEQTENMRKGAPLAKIVTFSSTSQTKLTYEETGYRTDTDFTDKYIDNLGNEYYFNSKDIFIGYSNNDEELSRKASTAMNKNNIISETEAFDIGKKTLQSLIGNDFKNYTHAETVLSDLGYYSITFEKKYADIAVGESAMVNVYVTGDVFYCYAWNLGEFEDFDSDTIAEITMEMLQNHVKEQYENATLKGVYLGRTEDSAKFVLKLYVSIPEQDSIYLNYEI